MSVCLLPTVSDCLCFYGFSTWNKRIEWLIDWLLKCAVVLKTDFKRVLIIMSTNPPPYAPDSAESKGLYPSLPEQQPQQPPPTGYYPHQPAPGYYPPPQQFFISPAPATVIVQPSRPVQSFVLHIVLSCFVFCCCGWICGLIAFILARKSTVYSVEYLILCVVWSLDIIITFFSIMSAKNTVEILSPPDSPNIPVFSELNSVMIFRLELP